MIVTLTWSEVLLAAQVAAMRNVQCLKEGRPPRYGAPSGEGAWGVNIEGACGEMAVAKMLDIYWSGALGNLKAMDVGQYQVRTNTSLTHDDLRLHPDDADDRHFIALNGRAPTFHIHGWILGSEGKQQKWWRDGAPGRPAFWVPKAALHPLETLLQVRTDALREVAA